jgi:hypothetical protein
VDPKPAGVSASSSMSEVIDALEVDRIFFAAFIYVPHGGGRCHFQMFVDGLFSQTWPSYEMAVFDSL